MDFIRKGDEMKQTLKSLRLENRKIAAEVAAALGIARSTYSNYEQGIRQIDLRLIMEWLF